MTKLGIAVMLMAALVVVTGVRAQDDTPLEERVSALETRVAALEGETVSAPVGTPHAGNVVTFTGTGNHVTAPIDLPTGNLILTLELERTAFAWARLYAWPGETSTFSAATSGETTGSTVLRIREAGTFVVDVAVPAGIAWTVTIQLPE